MLDSMLWVTGVEPNAQLKAFRAAGQLLTHYDSCVRACVRVEFRYFLVCEDKLADRRYHPPAEHSRVLNTVKTLNSINAIHHPGDTLCRFGVLRCVKCSGLCPISFVYKVWAVYVWMGGGAGGAGLCACGISGGRGELVALINTCRHGL